MLLSISKLSNNEKRIQSLKSKVGIYLAVWLIERYDPYFKSRAALSQYIFEL